MNDLIDKYGPDVKEMYGETLNKSRYTDGKNSVRNTSTKGSSARVNGKSGAGSQKGTSASGSVSYKTSPKTGAALPALPFVAVFAAAGIVVCGRKARKN